MPNKNYDDALILRALSDPEGETEIAGLMWSEYVPNLEIIYHAVRNNWQIQDEEKRWNLEEMAHSHAPVSVKYIRAITHGEYDRIGLQAQETILALKAEHEVEQPICISPSDIFIIGATFASLISLYYSIMTLETE